MSTGEYIDSLLEEYIDSLLEEIETLKRERDLYEHECSSILKIIFEGIESPSYINPWGVFKYLKAIYPNRYNRKMETFNVADE